MFVREETQAGLRELIIHYSIELIALQPMLSFPWNFGNKIGVRICTFHNLPEFLPESIIVDTKRDI